MHPNRTTIWALLGLLVAIATFSGASAQYWAVQSTFQGSECGSASLLSGWANPNATCDDQASTIRYCNSTHFISATNCADPVEVEGTWNNTFSIRLGFALIILTDPVFSYYCATCSVPTRRVYSRHRYFVQKVPVPKHCDDQSDFGAVRLARGAHHSD